MPPYAINTFIHYCRYADDTAKRHTILTLTTDISMANATSAIMSSSGSCRHELLTILLLMAYRLMPIRRYSHHHARHHYSAAMSRHIEGDPLVQLEYWRCQAPV